MGLTTYQDFRAFLVEEGCEEAFDRAFYNHNHATAFDQQMWDAVCDKSFVLGCVFHWDATPEGRTFWKQIDTKWQRLLLRRFATPPLT